jgi:hypothetical protein
MAKRGHRVRNLAGFPNPAQWIQLLELLLCKCGKYWIDTGVDPARSYARRGDSERTKFSCE